MILMTPFIFRINSKLLGMPISPPIIWSLFLQPSLPVVSHTEFFLPTLTVYTCTFISTFSFLLEKGDPCLIYWLWCTVRNIFDNMTYTYLKQICTKQYLAHPVPSGIIHSILFCFLNVNFDFNLTFISWTLSPVLENHCLSTSWSLDHLFTPLGKSLPTSKCQPKYPLLLKNFCDQ